MGVLDVLSERWELLSEWLRERNIPPIIIPLFLLLLLGAAFYAGSIYKPTVGEFRLLVRTADGQSVDGALVEVYDGTKLLTSAESANGVAVFKNLPSKSLLFKIAKRDFDLLERTLDLSQRTTSRVELTPIATPTPNPTVGPALKRGYKVSLKLVDANKNTPITEAKVVYSFDSTTDSVFSDAEGNAALDVPKDAAIRIRAIHSAYKTKDATLLATKASDILSLEPKKTGELFLAGTGKLVVVAQDKQGAPVTSGTVKVYDSTTSALLKTGQLGSNGKIELELNLPAKVTVSIDASGFLPYSSGSVLPIEVKEYTTHIANLEKPTVQNSDKTKIKTVDEQGGGLKARVLIYAYPSTTQLLDKTTADNGELELTLAKDGSYYALALLAGKVVVLSAPFSGGDTVTLTLKPATVTTAGTLTVGAADKKLNPLVGATVVLLSPAGLAFSLPATTGTDGSVKFENLPLGQSLMARGVRFELTGETTLLLDATQTITLQLFPKPGTIDVSALDLSTNQGLAAAFVAKGEDGRKIADCRSTPTSGCRLEVNAEEYITVTGTIAGFGDASTTVYLKSGESVSKQLSFIPASLLQDVQLVYEGVFDPLGTPTKVLRPGGLYKARFVIAGPEGVDRIGFAVRAGERGAIAEEPLGITDFSGADSVARSTTWNPGATCGDVQNFEGSLLKWVQLEYAGAGSRTIEVSFEVREDATPQEVKLFYRAYSLKGQAYRYNPPDSRLGTGRRTASLDGCYAESRSDMVEIIAPGKVTPPPTITADFTPSAKVAYDAVIRKLISDVKEFDLQVDPVFPRDALPFDIDTNQVLVEPVKSEGGTAPCYRFDFARKLLVFESGDTKPACPIKAKGDTIAGDESASVRFAYIPDPTKDLTIKIKVIAKAVSPLKSLYAKPDNVAGDAARLFYLINERQKGTRVVRAQFEGGEREFVFDKPDAYAIAWRGPGGLSFGEEGETLATVNYAYLASYFKNRGGMGGSMTANNCNGFLCCAEGWCTTTSATKAVDDAKTQADSLARQTAFRRGKGEPWKTLAGANEPFHFVTVLQLKEGASLPAGGAATALGLNTLNLQASTDSGVISKPLPAGCQSGNPQVVKLTSASRDGSAWTYTADPMQLNTVNYLSGACPGEQVTVSGSSAINLQGGGSVSLCNFLYGDGSCLGKSAAPVISSQAQRSFDEPSQQGNQLPLLLGLSMLPALLKGLGSIGGSGGGTGGAGGAGGSGPGGSLVLSDCEPASKAWMEARTASQKSLDAINPALTGEQTNDPCKGQAAVCRQGVAALRTAYTGTYKQCIDAKDVSQCAPDITTKVGQAKGQCSSCSATTAKLTEFETTFKKETDAGTKCDQTKGSFVIDGYPYTRSAWYTCYAKSDNTCVKKCQARISYCKASQPPTGQPVIRTFAGIDASCNEVPAPGTCASLAATASTPGPDGTPPGIVHAAQTTCGGVEACWSSGNVCIDEIQAASGTDPLTKQPLAKAEALAYTGAEDAAAEKAGIGQFCKLGASATNPAAAKAVQDASKGAFKPPEQPLERSEGGACHDDADCQSGLVCKDGKCTKPQSSTTPPPPTTGSNTGTQPPTTGAQVAGGSCTYPQEITDPGTRFRDPRFASSSRPCPVSTSSVCNPDGSTSQTLTGLQTYNCALVCQTSNTWACTDFSAYCGLGYYRAGGLSSLCTLTSGVA